MMRAAPSIASARRPSGLRLGSIGGASRAVERWLETEREALALWIPVAIGSGAALWFILPGHVEWLEAAAALAAAGTLALALAPGRRTGRSLGVFGLLAALGLLLGWARAERVAAPVLARTMVATVTGRVLQVEPQPARGRTRLTLAVAQSELPPRIRLNVDTDKLAPLVEPGAIVSVRARLLPPAAAEVPGGYDFAEVAWFARLGATGKALDRLQVSGPPAEGSMLGRVRLALTRHIEAAVPGSPGGVAASLVTGDVGAVDPADADAMRRSGLAHLLSISGLHVTAVVAAAMLLTMRLLALSPRLALSWPLPLIAAAAGALAGLGYTLLSGAEVPTIRSCVASLLVIGGLALGREALTLRLVAAGAALVLLLWPEAIAGPSFQLSFAAVTTIVALHEHPRIRALFLRRDEPLWRRLLRAVGSLVLTGLVVEAALAPIALYHFERAGLYGAFANIVAIPLTTFVIMPLEAGALLLDVAGLGAPLWWVAGQALRLLLMIAHAVGEAPGAVTLLPGMPVGAFALSIAGGLWLLLWRTRVRRLGLVPLAMGALWTLTTPAPDLLVTGDGRHLALRTIDGRLALLRDRTGDYVQGLLGEAAGVAGEPQPLDEMPGARCSADACLVAVATPGGVRRILATRSAYPLPRRALLSACARADIVVSDRRLPPACSPRWLRADPGLLGHTGGLAINLSDQTARSVRQPRDEHPWIVPPRPASPRSSPGFRWRTRPRDDDHPAGYAAGAAA